MKNKITTLTICGLLCLSTVQGQRTTTFNAEQQNRIETLKQKYVAKGISLDIAESRATSIIQNQSRMTLRSRVNPPSSNSIWIDRDTADWTNYNRTYHNYTPEELVKKVLLNNPSAQSAITNVRFKGHNWNGSSWTGDDRSLHYFENGHKLGIDHGLILATGPALAAEGPNNATAEMGGGTSVDGDTDLATICNDIYSGSVLEFDFVPYTNKATFDFVFVSEEYGDYSNIHDYNDAFGFFVSKADGSTPHINIARFPNDSVVTISNSNWGYRDDESSTYYTNHPADTTGLSAAGWPVPNQSTIAVNPWWHKPNPTDGGDYMEYDGQTVKLQAVAKNLIKGEKYHLKLAICNKGDTDYGSAVFLANLDLGTPDIGVNQPYLGAWNRAWDKYGENNLYSDCTQTMTLKITPDTIDREIKIDYIGAASKKTIVQTDGTVFPDKLNLAAGDSVITIPFKTLTVPLEDNGKEGAVVACIVGGGCDTMKNKTTGKQFKFYSGISSQIKYIPPTTNYPGSLKLNIKGGSNYLFRSLDKGISWEFARDTATGEERPFAKWQIYNFSKSDKIIWLREPNACSEIQFYHFTKDSLGSPSSPIISRPIIFPNVPNAISNMSAGIHYVNSGKDFSFKITPTGDNIGKTPVVKTGRLSASDTEGVYIQDNKDGSFTVTIYEVREPLNLNITFSSQANSNIETESESVWSNNGILYISSSTSGNAKVYNILGSLNRTITLSPKETISVTLPAGIYVVSMSNGKVYKVAIR